MMAVSPGAVRVEGQRLHSSRKLLGAPMRLVQQCALVHSCGSIPPAISWGTFKRCPIHSSPSATHLPAATGSRPSTASRLLPPPESKQLLASTWKLLQSSFWPVLLIYAAKDTLAFILHRLGHRLTNFVAEAALGIPISSLINPWWLLLDSRFLESNYGYQAVIALVFIVCLPLNILLNSYAMSATMHLVKAKADAAATAEADAAAAAAEAGSSKSSEGGEEQAGPLASSAAATASGLGTGTGGSSSSAAGPGPGEATSPRVPLADPSASVTSSSSSSADRSSSSSSSSADRIPAPPSSDPSLQAGPSSLQSSSSPDSAAPGTAGTSGAERSLEAPASWMERAASMLGLRSAPHASSGQAPVQGTAAAASSPGDSPPSSSTAAAAAPPAPSGGFIKSLKLAWADAWAVAPEVRRSLHRVWLADLTFNLQALPLQALSLLLFPLFWTLPRLLDIQLSVPVAISEGLDGKSALQRSRQLMSGFKRAYAWPFAVLLLSIRLVDALRTALLTLVPPRWWQEIIELPVLLIVAFGFAKIVLIRLQDILPATTYLHLSSCPEQGQQEAAPEATQPEPTSPAIPCI